MDKLVVLGGVVCEGPFGSHGHVLLVTSSLLYSVSILESPPESVLQLHLLFLVLTYTAQTPVSFSKILVPFSEILNHFGKWRFFEDFPWDSRWFFQSYPLYPSWSALWCFLQHLPWSSDISLSLMGAIFFSNIQEWSLHHVSTVFWDSFKDLKFYIMGDASLLVNFSYLDQLPQDPDLYIFSQNFLGI